MFEETVEHINLGTNPGVYHLRASHSPAKYDVLFVGNSHPWSQYQKTINFDQFEQPVQRGFLHAREKLQARVTRQSEADPYVLSDVESILRGSLETLNLRNKMDAQLWRQHVLYFRYRVAHYVLREMYVRALAEFRLGLFGRGWDMFQELASHAQPTIDNGEALREVIGESAISLHLPTWTVHHPRLYDTAGASGLLLVGRVKEAYPLEQVFEVGGELDSFASISELKRKIRYYLDHPDQRRQMGERAAKRAQQCHSMATRMKQWLKNLSDGQGENANKDNESHDNTVACAA